MSGALSELNLIWLTGASCDGCSISVLGDDADVAIEDLLLGRVEGLPRIRLVHPLLSFEEGSAFVDLLRAAAAGASDPYVLVMESSVPRELASGSFASIGEEGEKLIDIAEWVRRLAGGAEIVIAIGDCGVFGGPHSDESNPSGAKGIESIVGFRFRSRAGMPIIHLPGCSVPPVFISTLTTLVRHWQGEGPALELDPLGRPTFAYPS
ncbi:MAG: hypothetical protein M3041_11595 [Acidobacteriota bacterium]|nr:hypothetical protein [Acidobacteriota bacterium]